MSDGVLNGPRPLELLVQRLSQHRHQCRITRPEYLSQKVRVVLIHLREQWLQGALSDIPLQHAKTDPLVVEVAGQSRKTIRRGMIRLEAAGQCQTLMVQRLCRHCRYGNVRSVE